MPHCFSNLPPSQIHQTLTHTHTHAHSRPSGSSHFFRALTTSMHSNLPPASYWFLLWIFFLLPPLPLLTPAYPSGPGMDPNFSGKLSWASSTRLCALPLWCSSILCFSLLFYCNSYIILKWYLPSFRLNLPYVWELCLIHGCISSNKSITD